MGKKARAKAKRAAQDEAMRAAVTAWTGLEALEVVPARRPETERSPSATLLAVESALHPATALHWAEIDHEKVLKEFEAWHLEAAPPEPPAPTSTSVVAT